MLATKATTPTANTTRPHPDFVRSGDPSAPAPAGPARSGGEKTGGETRAGSGIGAASGAGHFDGGDIGVMMTV